MMVSKLWSVECPREDQVEYQEDCQERNLEDILRNLEQHRVNLILEFSLFTIHIAMKRVRLEEVDSKSFLSLEETFLSDELLRKAENELNETEENRKECLQDLRNLISSEKNLESDTEEGFLLRFLRARKFDTKRAFNLLKKYYSHQANYPNVYKDFRPSTAINELDSNSLGFLPSRNAAGCAIAIGRFGMWDPNVSVYEDMLRCYLMCLEKTVSNEITQICGMITIADFTRFSLSHLLHLTPRRVYCFISAFLDVFPLRLKEVHVINHSKLFSVLFAIIRPFLSKKIHERITFHGSNLESLHQYISPSILPEEFGGELGPSDNSNFARLLLESEQTFINNQRFGYVRNTKKF